MTTNVPLKKLYSIIKSSFPEYYHDSKKFQEYLLNELSRDPIRTSSLRKSISNRGLDFELKSFYPLNDFLHGTFEYLKYIGVNKKDALDFEKKYQENDLLFK